MLIPSSLTKPTSSEVDIDHLVYLGNWSLQTFKKMLAVTQLTSTSSWFQLLLNRKCRINVKNPNSHVCVYFYYGTTQNALSYPQIYKKVQPPI